MFSVFSGQARVVQASTVSGSGIHLIHGLSSSDSDDDEGYDDDYFNFHRDSVPVPPSMSTKLVNRFNTLIIINFNDFWVYFSWCSCDQSMLLLSDKVVRADAFSSFCKMLVLPGMRQQFSTTCL